MVVSFMGNAIGSSFEDFAAETALIALVHSTNVFLQLLFMLASKRASVTEKLDASSTMNRLYKKKEMLEYNFETKQLRATIVKKRKSYLNMSFAVKRRRKALVTMSTAERLLPFVDPQEMTTELRPLPERLRAFVTMKRSGHGGAIRGNGLDRPRAAATTTHAAAGCHGASTRSGVLIVGGGAARGARA